MTPLAGSLNCVPRRYSFTFGCCFLADFSDYRLGFDLQHRDFGRTRLILDSMQRNGQNSCVFVPVSALYKPFYIG
jgi:hypothetical protein